MSFSLKLHGGDLAVEGERSQLVTGISKLLQDLDIWMRENFRIDRFHPNYGSTLDSYIGGIADPDTLMRVESEAARVLRNYQNLQVKRVQDQVGKYSYDEILQQVTGIRAVVELDRLFLHVSIRTASGNTGSVNVSVTT